MVGVGAVAAEGVYAGFDVYFLAVEVYVAAFGAVGLDVSSGCACGLVANEEYVCAFVS